MNGVSVMLSEKLSAFIDGELGRPEEEDLLSEMQHDSDACAAWDRMCFIGAALRQEEPFQVPRGFAASVMEQLEQTGAELATPQPKVVPLRTRRNRTWVGMAVAASVAAAVVLVVYQPSIRRENSSRIPATAAKSVNARTVANRRSSPAVRESRRTVDARTANRGQGARFDANQAVDRAYMSLHVVGVGNMRIINPGAALKQDMLRASRLDWARLIQPFPSDESHQWKIDTAGWQLRQASKTTLRSPKGSQEKHVADSFGFMMRPVSQDIGNYAFH